MRCLVKWSLVRASSAASRSHIDKTSWLGLSYSFSLANRRNTGKCRDEERYHVGQPDLQKVPPRRTTTENHITLVDPHENRSDHKAVSKTATKDRGAQGNAQKRRHWGQRPIELLFFSQLGPECEPQHRTATEKNAIMNQWQG